MSLLVGLDVGTGGGARNNLWRQLQADVYGVPIHRTMADEGPAHGAALLSGVAANVYGDLQEACSMVRLRGEVTEPQRERIYEEHYEVYRALYPATASAMHRLAEHATADNQLETANARRSLKTQESAVARFTLDRR